ncbi:MAG: DUF4159 domain-containing protein [Candidatus Zhuqueibacterota bacterium]
MEIAQFEYKIARSALVVTFVISVALHSGMLFINYKMPQKEVEVKRKPLSVKFIQQAPRLMKTLELVKRPTTVQRTLTKRFSRTATTSMRSVRTAAIHGGTVLASLAPPTAEVERRFTPQRLDLGPEIIAAEVTNVKESAVKELRDDLLTAAAMDYGRFSSFAVQNPDDKQDVEGFIYVALVKYRTDRVDSGNEPDWNTSAKALPNIAAYLNDHTGVNAKFAGVVTLDSDELRQKKLPFLFMTGHYSFDFTPIEAENLGHYLREGGFLLIDDSFYFKGGPFDISARSLVTAALGDQTVFERVPNDHRMYHCFFDFNGPPVGDDVVNNWTSRLNGAQTTYDYLDAVFYEGRMVVLISNKSYNNAWNADPHWRPGTPNSLSATNIRQLQFAVNIVVFVLLQPGGYTQQNARYK